MIAFVLKTLLFVYPIYNQSFRVIINTYVCHLSDIQQVNRHLRLKAPHILRRSNVDVA